MLFILNSTCVLPNGNTIQTMIIFQYPSSEKLYLSIFITPNDTENNITLNLIFI